MKLWKKDWLYSCKRLGVSHTERHVELHILEGGCEENGISFKVCSNAECLITSELSLSLTLKSYLESGTHVTFFWLLPKKKEIH